MINKLLCRIVGHKWEDAEFPYFLEGHWRNTVSLCLHDMTIGDSEIKMGRYCKRCGKKQVFLNCCWKDYK